MSEEEILSQCFIFLIAGVKTTSTALNFAIHTLAMNPKMQQKLYDEIKQNLIDKQQFDYDSINSLTYLEACIKETLRMYPPVVVMDRVAAEDVALGDEEVRIKKGTVVNLPIYAIQHDPILFPEPHAFKPERFLPENQHLIEHYSFIPFGVGPRICIGMRFALMNVKLFLVHFLTRFEILKLDNTPSKPKFNIAFIELSAKPMYVQFVSRQ